MSFDRQNNYNQGENDPLLTSTMGSTYEPPPVQPLQSPPPQAYQPPPQNDYNPPVYQLHATTQPRGAAWAREEFISEDGNMQISGLEEVCCVACWQGHKARIFHPKNDDHIVLNKNTGFICCPDYSHDVLLLDEITGGQVRSSKSIVAMVLLLVSTIAATTFGYFQFTALQLGYDTTFNWVLLSFLALIWVCCVINFFVSRVLGVQFFKQRGNLFLELPHSLGSRSLGYDFDISTTQGLDDALKFVDTMLAKAKLARSKSRTYNNQETLRVM